jgi:hypothetical protein
MYVPAAAWRQPSSDFLFIYSGQTFIIFVEIEKRQLPKGGGAPVGELDGKKQSRILTQSGVGRCVMLARKLVISIVLLVVACVLVLPQVDVPDVVPVFSTAPLSDHVAFTFAALPETGGLSLLPAGESWRDLAALPGRGERVLPKLGFNLRC